MDAFEVWCKSSRLRVGLFCFLQNDAEAEARGLSKEDARARAEKAAKTHAGPVTGRVSTEPHDVEVREVRFGDGGAA